MTLRLCAQRRLSAACAVCASPQSGLVSLCCSSKDTRILALWKGVQRLWLDCTDVQADMRLRWGATCPIRSVFSPLRKHAYSNILKILSPKKWTFSDKNSYIFPISAQNIDCGYSLEPPRRGGSNVYPQSMFLSTNKKIMYTSVNPSFSV